MTIWVLTINNYVEHGLGGGKKKKDYNTKHKRNASHHSKMWTNWDMMLYAAQ